MLRLPAPVLPVGQSPLARPSAYGTSCTCCTQCTAHLHAHLSGSVRTACSSLFDATATLRNGLRNLTWTSASNSMVMLASAAGTSGLRAHLLLTRVLGRYRVERLALKRGSGFLHRLAGILPFCSDTVCVCVGRHCGRSLGVCAEAAHGQGTKAGKGAR